MLWFLLLLAFLLTAGIIIGLHRNEMLKRKDIIDRSAPLASVDFSFLQQDERPQGADGAEEGAQEEPWQGQVRRFREAGDLAAALALCRRQYPRIQAFQQAAVILRQQIRELIEQHKPVSAELLELYRLAVLADLYRTSNTVKPLDPAKTLQALKDVRFDYQAIGSRRLRLLTKSDIRHLEQLWGRPRMHQHAEQALGAQWQQLCGI